MKRDIKLYTTNNLLDFEVSISVVSKKQPGFSRR